MKNTKIYTKTEYAALIYDLYHIAGITTIPINVSPLTFVGGQGGDIPSKKVRTKNVTKELVICRGVLEDNLEQYIQKTPQAIEITKEIHQNVVKAISDITIEDLRAPLTK